MLSFRCILLVDQKTNSIVKTWEFPTVELRCRKLADHGTLHHSSQNAFAYLSLPLKSADLLNISEEKKSQLPLLQERSGGCTILGIPCVQHINYEAVPTVLSGCAEILRAIAELARLTSSDTELMDLYMSTTFPFGSLAGELNVHRWLAENWTPVNVKTSSYVGVVVTHTEVVASAQYGRCDIEDLTDIEGCVAIQVDNMNPESTSNPEKPFTVQVVLSYPSTSINSFELHPSISEVQKTDNEVPLPTRRWFLTHNTQPVPNRMITVVSKVTHGPAELIKYKSIPQRGCPPPVQGKYTVTRSADQTLQLHLDIRNIVHLPGAQGVEVDAYTILLQFGGIKFVHQLKASHGCLTMASPTTLEWSLVPRIVTTDMSLSGTVQLQELYSPSALNCAAVVKWRMKDKGSLTGAVLIAKNCVVSFGELKCGQLIVKTDEVRQFMIWNSEGQSVHTLPQVTSLTDVTAM